ncbi:CAP domain-containing protein [Rapidithrix thailandica]|uniref:CAP domain-containing protein n=1 Tax=Rapidithrix thailandica TaxID=413964 RepID=A0AAW9S7J3_9BACT
MMKYTFLWCLCLFCHAPLFCQSGWEAEMYQTHNYQTFSQLPQAQKPIVLKDIDYPLLNAAVFYETNRIRAKHKLPLCQYSPTLEQVAWEHSKDMVKYNFYSHKSKVKGKRTMTDRLNAAGLVNTFAAENIAYTFAIQLTPNRAVYGPSQNGGYFSYQYKGAPIPTHTYLSFAKSILQEWMNSPGHRANILDRNYRYLGCGTYLDKVRKKDQPPYFKTTQNFSSDDPTVAQ